ncbi:anaerobic C4-dicarboxylate transporter [Ktedonobacter racemifer DSM 44963]|uniref:Anaerobic C4-dicarboxylate transporter n=1 Tax=Ktedonobacter racemifer DSM 44963 TaxID=485913 RepID=D6TYY3_KTERA|nr:anaerobic C4-dicarboxylate transporter [Ktedonobacter racemifer DSM 44963]
MRVNFKITRMGVIREIFALALFTTVAVIGFGSSPLKAVILIICMEVIVHLVSFLQARAMNYQYQLARKRKKNNQPTM